MSDEVNLSIKDDINNAKKADPSPIKIALTPNLQNGHLSHKFAKSNKKAFKKEPNFLQELRLRYSQKNLRNDDESDSSSFESESSDASPENKTSDETPELNNYVQLYKSQHGGILIYDIDADIPNQPVPRQEHSIGTIINFYY
jgi:AraC-like DNA-binding protein